MHNIGLKHIEVKRLFRKFGPNEIIQEEKFKIFKIFCSQFKSFLIVILIFAGTISLFLTEPVDALAIFAIVILNALIGFSQEYKAENAVKALKKLVVHTTIVLRDGVKKKLPIRELVPGDIIFLEEGDKIPADAKIIESYSLLVDESMLSGESITVSKNKKHNLNTLYKGTIITSGHAKAKVFGTGLNTEFGKIIKLINQKVDERSPLSIQLDTLGKKLGIAVLIIVTILFLVGTLKGFGLLEMFMTSVALAVSVIPEGLPIIMTLTLTIGMQILSYKNAIVRKMNAIETLGATTVICTDKTGTLTLNEMTVKKIYTAKQEHYIPGEGYEIKEKINLKYPAELKLLEICENCNNAEIGETTLGDPTEIALKILVAKNGKNLKHRRIDEKVFNSDRKLMSTLCQNGKTLEIYTKGAFEELIQCCSHILINNKTQKITEKHISELEKNVEDYSKNAMRVLAAGYRKIIDKKNFREERLTFIGLVAMIDPARENVKESISIAKKAGIKIKIITGDHPITAKAIAKEIGLKSNSLLTGAQIDLLSDSALKKLLKKTVIFARTRPDHKFRLVNLLKQQNEIVAVTGDGINDAPAIKHADVGIAMGIKGTEATKEVADIILKDDNFSTIVTTIEEGRRIYKNILAFIKYMLATNFSSLTTVGIITIIGLPLPVLPLQILWINIATDALPALALGKSKASPGIMKEKPHPKKENILKRFHGIITVTVILQTVANIIVFLHGVKLDKINQIATENLNSGSYARTLVFTEIILFELFFTFICKDEKFTLKNLSQNYALIFAVLISIFLQIIMIYAPFMQRIFKTVPLGINEWLILIALASSAFLSPSILKNYTRIKSKICAST